VGGACGIAGFDGGGGGQVTEHGARLLAAGFDDHRDRLDEAAAGLEPWPKLFQNLRATRETELAETYPMHVVCAWIGNSAAIAAKHYLQVTDEHFDKATHFPTQQAAALSAWTRKLRKRTRRNSGNPLFLRSP